ncbi:hypothetical protein CC78DRAFT_583341 [Lojkania enalia]|uniref:Uncharacterized protein n=1 Tax=Lojkania enalia TaxID=147567 RepID=A0A9P4N1R2_9PLEO|nr:hypothetical protein CC78DRAFT_583341 [Didymosphaeria enalia]
MQLFMGLSSSEPEGMLEFGVITQNLAIRTPQLPPLILLHLKSPLSSISDVASVPSSHFIIRWPPLEHRMHWFRNVADAIHDLLLHIAVPFGYISDLFLFIRNCYLTDTYGLNYFMDYDPKPIHKGKLKHFVLICHAERNDNEKTLTPTGLSQVTTLTTEFRKAVQAHKPSAIVYSSPVEHCLQTLQPIFNVLAIDTAPGVDFQTSAPPSAEIRTLPFSICVRWLKTAGRHCTPSRWCTEKSTRHVRGTFAEPGLAEFLDARDPNWNRARRNFTPGRVLAAAFPDLQIDYKRPIIPEMLSDGESNQEYFFITRKLVIERIIEEDVRNEDTVIICTDSTTVFGIHSLLRKDVVMLPRTSDWDYPKPCSVTCLEWSGWRWTRCTCYDNPEQGPERRLYWEILGGFLYVFIVARIWKFLKGIWAVARAFATHWSGNRWRLPWFFSLLMISLSLSALYLNYMKLNFELLTQLRRAEVGDRFDEGILYGGLAVICTNLFQFAICVFPPILAG